MNGEQKKQKQADPEARNFLNQLTDSWDIDDELQDLFWAYASKDMVLSNLSKMDIKDIMDGFHDSVNDYIIQQPEHDFTWEESMAIGQFEDWLKVRLNRSYEGFERKMETTGTQIQKQILEGANAEEGIRDRLRKIVKGSEGEDESNRSVKL